MVAHVSCNALALLQSYRPQTSLALGNTLSQLLPRDSLASDLGGGNDGRAFRIDVSRRKEEILRKVQPCTLEESRAREHG